MTDEKNRDAYLRSGLNKALKPLWRFSFALSGKADLADDLSQSTCLRALDKSHQADVSRPLLPWFLTICRSIWLNEKRANAIRAAQSLDVTPESQLVALGLDTETNILSRQVYSLIMGLPEAQRTVAVLVFVEGFGYSEAAKVLDIPVGTVMSRLHAVRAKLRSVVENDADERTG